MGRLRTRRTALAGAIGLTAAAMVSVGLAVAGTASAASAAPAAATAKVVVAAPATTTAPATPSYTPPKRSLQLGDTGADVKALQERLNQLKYYSGTPDGDFGPNTEEAVWAFQEVNHLSVDGVVGPHTAHALVDPHTYVSNDPRQDALRVEVNLGMGVLVLYNHDKIELISHESSGGGYYFCNPGGGGCGYAITPTGNYRTTVFMPGWVTVPLGQMYNPVFFISTVYAIHGDTYVPIQPVSHGCVRIPMFIANFFHNLVVTPGTEVFVYN
jgi:peptidoglycan hydrolase-like protein with peptidoglycan-binding domain